ncbi:MAG: hypothetical protein IJW09_05690, partial [Clostridia bacterium]|nr:hypothetical protein [Clostridia bacterium]
MLSHKKQAQRLRPLRLLFYVSDKKVGLIFGKTLDFLSLLLYVVVLTGGATYEKYDKRAMARK